MAGSEAENRTSGAGNGSNTILGRIANFFDVPDFSFPVQVEIFS